MLRDNLAGSSSRCSAARGGLLSRCTLTGGSHRTIDPLCLENPRPARAEPTLTENVASPFQAEPRQCPWGPYLFCVSLPGKRGGGGGGGEGGRVRDDFMIWV